MTKGTFKEKFALTEDEIQDLIARAKVGDRQAQEKLFEVFSNYLSKYVLLLFHGKYNLKDSPDTRNFVALYVGDSQVRWPLLKNKLNSDGYRKVNEVISGLQYIIQRYGT